MNDIIFLSYNGSNVRTLEQDGQLWWVLADVCKILELSNASIVASRLDDDEVTKLDLGGQTGITNLINESGLYSVILRSDKPQAKPFRRWVTHDVLPQIRQNGYYSVETTAITEKTWYGEKMLTMNDAATVLGIDRRCARQKVVNSLRDGLDYFVIKGDSLVRFKYENPEFAQNSGSAILLIKCSEFSKRFPNCKYRQLKI